jgi:hypothetical protein
MKTYMGIWIDHSKAVIVSATARRVNTEVVTSDVDGHPRYSGGLGASGEKKYEAQHGQQLDQYYDEVIDHIVESDRLLFFGPGEAKLELKERLARSKAHAGRKVDIETTDKLTDPQIVAKVRSHFSIAR